MATVRGGCRAATAAPALLLLALLWPWSSEARERQPVHIFTYADHLHPNLCTLASSVEAIGARLNVLGLEDSDSAGAIPVSALRGMFGTIAAHRREPRRPHWRFSAAVECSTADECNVPKNMFKIRKLFSLWPHLKDFEEDEVLLFLDGFDTVLEAPSLEHLRGSFERLQARLANLVGGLPGGPVIFNGEANCWPFPHSGPVSGDYRPTYQYDLGNGTLLRGDKVCAHWAQAARRSFAEGGVGDGAPPGPIHLPFLNSGAFIGRVRSIRRLFELASELLHRFRDFDDQALVYAAALTAASADQPWAPLWVDAHGELLASLHGMDLELLARRTQAPQICDYHGRIYFGYFAAAMEGKLRLAQKPSRWNTQREKPPPPVVLHFNGDKKPYFDSRCSQSAVAQAHEAGVPPETCRVISYTLRTEFRFSSFKRDDEGTNLEERRVDMPRPRVTLSQTQVLAAGGLGRKFLDVARLLVSQAPGPQLVAPVQVPPPGAGVPPTCSVGRPWYWEDRGGRWSRQWSDERVVTQGSHDGVSLDGLFVRRNETRCAVRTGQPARGVESGYCRLAAALRSTWDCLRDGVEGSPGLFWAEFVGLGDFSEMNKRADADRYGRECASGAISPGEGDAAGGEGAPCPGQAVMDFFEWLPHWEVATFRFDHRDENSMVLALKLPRY